MSRFLKKEEAERRERDESARELAAGLMLDSEGRLHSTEGTAPAAAAVTGATENTPTRIKFVPPAAPPLQERVVEDKSGGGAVDQPEKKADSQGAAAVKGRGRGRPRSVPTATRVALAANQKLPAARVGSASLDAVEAATSTLTEAAGSEDVTATAAPKKPRTSRPRASKGASSAAPVTADIANASVVEGDATASTGKPLKQTNPSAARKTKKAVDTATAASTEKESTTSSSSSSSGSLSDSIDSILASIRADADIPR